jgi:hypothetical protein
VKRPVLLLLGLAALTAGPAIAQQAVVQGPALPTMHRIEAGRLDASGWTDARSTRGAFSIRMPCLYNEASLPSSEPEITTTAQTVACERADGSNFMVVRGGYTGGAASAQEYFDRGRTQSPFATSTQTLTSFAGRPAIEIVARPDGKCLWSRIVRDGPENIVLVVVAPDSICDQVRPMATTFFEALQIEAHR